MARKRIKLGEPAKYIGYCKHTGTVCFKQECINNIELVDEDKEEVDILLAWKEHIKFLIDNY